MIARVHPTAGRRLRRGVVLGVATLLVVLLSSPLAGQAPAVQAQAQSGSQTFSTCIGTGSPPTLTLPADTSVQVTVQGATGGEGDDAQAPSGNGGRGAQVQGTLNSTNEARHFTIYVGCTGQREGAPGNGFGYTDGGSRGRARSPLAGSGGTGGGSSAVLLVSGNTNIGPILVAGGGGGGGGGGGLGEGAGGNGGDAGNPPQPGEAGIGDVGGGGCAACVGGQMAGGGGDSSYVDDGGGGGGGGGGWCGWGCQDKNNGGGGQHADLGGGGGGGGAGNSFIVDYDWMTDTSLGTSSLSGDGQITLSWTPAAPGEAEPASVPMTVSGQVHHLIPPLVSEGQIEHSLTPHTGATVEALVGSTVCGTAVTDATGRFQMTVAAHPATPGCGRPGATVRFRVEGTEHPETVPFVSGGAAEVALRSSDAPLVPPRRWP